LLPGVLTQLGRAALELSAELEKVRAAIKPLAGRPGPTRAALDDIASQLTRMIPPDLMRVTPSARLAHLTRYLKAILVRLQRLSYDPMKDQQKAAHIAPFWQGYLKKRDELQGRGYLVAELEEFGWLLEELRVQTFAPELKTAVPVSAQRLQDLWLRFGR
nr:DUF3418 domain-containing protein [Myxococcota bacterium]